MPAPINPSFEWETVGIPIIAGLDLQTPARLVDARSLLIAKNARFIRGKGIGRRNGYTATAPRYLDLSASLSGSYSPPPHPTTGPTPRDPFDPNVVLPSQWLFGYGIHQTNNTVPRGLGTSFSMEREPGILAGAASRGSEDLVWDGFRFFSGKSTPGTTWDPVGAFKGPWATAGDDAIAFSTEGRVRRRADAIMPWTRHNRVPSATNAHQYHADCADNGIMRLVSCVAPRQTDFAVTVTIVDSVTGTAMIVDEGIQTDTSDLQARALPCGDYLHVIVRNQVARSLTLHTYGPTVAGTIPTLTTRVLSASQIDGFDIRKVSESKFTVLRVFNNTLHEVAEFNPDGSYLTANFAAWTSFSKSGGSNPILGNSAIAIHPVTGRICIVWRAADIWSCVYSTTGVPIAAAATAVDTYGGSVNHHITLEAEYLLRDFVAGSGEAFRYFFDGPDPVDNQTYIVTGTCGAIGATNYITAPGLRTGAPNGVALLASNAFRVGHRVFVWGFIGEGGNQNQFVLFDDQLIPVGTALQGFADETLSGHQLTTVNWYDPTPGNTLPPKDRLVFHMALSARDVSGAAAGAAELHLDRVLAYHVELDFMPPLRHAQLGEVTYFPGSQLWSYDGTTLGEANPISIPACDVTSAAGAVNLSYRIYMAWTNAVGERVMGAAVTQDFNAKAFPSTLAIRPSVTRRQGAYYLIYRRVGTVFHLVSSTAPDSALYAPVKHDNVTTFVDTTVDAVALINEADPHNDSTLIPNFRAPASEVIAAANDRLWLAGGEIEPGTIRASKLHKDTTVPGWSPIIGSPIKRGEPITAIGSLTSFMAIFTKDRVYTLEGEGPNDQATGSWQPPQLAFADEGALSHAALSQRAAGLTFQSAEGIRILGQNGQVQKLGSAVDTLAKDLRITGVYQGDRELHFYHPNGALVLDEDTGAWWEWTYGGLGVCGKTRATLARATGDVAVQDEDEWIDTDVAVYPEYRIRMSWLRRGDLGDFQRARRIGVLGKSLGAPPPNNGELTVRTYMDESETPVDSWTTDEWTGPYMVLRRLSRQKCSVISVEIVHTIVEGIEPGPAITGVTIELGKRNGLMRIPRV